MDNWTTFSLKSEGRKPSCTLSERLIDLIRCCIARKKIAAGREVRESRKAIGEPSSDDNEKRLLPQGLPKRGVHLMDVCHIA